MKRSLIFFISIFFSLLLFAQVPQKMSYQAIVRDAEKNLVTNTTIGMQISILRGSETGKPVYMETQLPETNDNGMISIDIGTGQSSYKFSGIDWGSDVYFIKTEIDLSGGTDYSIVATSQLLSVPYAFYAHESGSSLWGQTSSNELYYLGGNIGIGTTNPAYELDVINNSGEAYARIRANSASSSLIIDKYSTVHNAHVIFQQNHESKFYTGLLGNNNYRISTDMTSLNGLEVQESGKVIFSNNFKMSSGAGAGKVLTSDASGNASWQTVPGNGGAETKYLSIPGVAFKNELPDNPTTSAKGSIMAWDENTANQMEVSCAVMLPAGALITGFKVTLVDNSSQNMQIGFYCNEFQSSNALTSMDTDILILTSSGSSAAYRTFTADLSGIDPYILTIDKDKAYYIYASWYHGSSGIKMALSRVLISYTE